MSEAFDTIRETGERSYAIRARSVQARVEAQERRARSKASVQRIEARALARTLSAFRA